MFLDLFILFESLVVVFLALALAPIGLGYLAFLGLGPLLLLILLDTHEALSRDDLKRLLGDYGVIAVLEVNIDAESDEIGPGGVRQVGP